MLAPIFSAESFYEIYYVQYDVLMIILLIILCDICIYYTVTLYFIE